ncbi:MAG: outer membrane beta-barrel protein [Flavobacteriales bacterium]|nr:outer membrane beta-barrel protein [Flavobacteriales bacterium]
MRNTIHFSLLLGLNCLLFLLNGQSAFAQEAAEKPVKWGFNVGAAYSLYLADERPSDAVKDVYRSATISSGFGASAGISLEVKVKEQWYFRPQVNFTYLSNRLQFVENDIRERGFDLYPITIDIPLHVSYSPKNKAHYFAGVKPMFLAPNFEDNNIKSPPINATFDLGWAWPVRIGEHGKFLVEWSYGLMLFNPIPESDNIHTQWFSSPVRHQTGFRIHLY